MRGRVWLLAAAERVQRAQLWIAVVALVVLMMVTVFDVFLRYVFNSPIRSSYELVEAMLLVFVFNGMAAGFFGRRNVVIDILDSTIGQRAAAVLIRVADLLSVCCLGLLMWAMLLPAAQSYDYGEQKMELHLPIYVLWVAALISLAGAVFCAFATLLAKPALADVGRLE